ncbi:MAG: hypothetical protein HW403_1096, partial [Dehalococcoidia bacterium]|nr:hypothetical protein [Dehalococcoidia bacterium]
TLYTSGFAETGTDEGRRLQTVVTEMAKEGDLNLVGPNCMGIYNPKLGLRFGGEQAIGEDATGGVAFISQSGSQGSGFSIEANRDGIGISKVVSFGNGVVLDNYDYLEYFADDPDTKVIAMYVEGTRNGRRFFQTLREVAKRKPVIIWKGGITEESARAASSHSGSLAIPSAIWDAMLKQCNVVNVHGMAETIDAVKAILFSPPISTPPRMGLIAASGGHSVEISDAFSLEGLKVPRLSEESYEKLESFYSVVGGSFRNPIEGGGNWRREETAGQVLNILEQDPNVDAVVMELGAGGFGRADPGAILQRVETIVRYKEKMTKPFWAVLGGDAMRGDPERMREASRKLQEGGIPVFQTFVRAAGAMRKLLDYYSNKQ